MKNTIETFQQALLIFTIIVLVYVLYSRLLRVLGKKEKNTHYAEIGETLRWNGKEAEIEVTLHEEMHLMISVCSADGTKIKDLYDQTYIAGKYHLVADCSGLENGRYYFRLVSPAQDHSLYFNIG